MPNALIKEKSPYLIQHAHNPVNWRPWSDETFETARLENKPVFLSVGYAACHWCHVMERESFEDPEAASYLNDTFVCVKVDREERPDIDAVYMSVCHMLTGSGGWPLSIFMTPEKQPFFAATYIPKTSRYGRPGIIDLCRNIQILWTQQPEKIHSSAAEISNHLKQAFSYSSQADFDPAAFDNAYEQLLKRYDPEYAGFGPAPKFPGPHIFLFLLRYHLKNPGGRALEMVQNTLSAMRLGGIWDHVGFGFHRYSTDREWLLPHFEKMLYDQALMTAACLETGLVSGDRFHLDTADKILTYVFRDMTSGEGPFYTAEDADSEGEEGKFYVWTSDEFRNTLGGENASQWETLFNVKPAGNFMDEATRRPTGANILHLNQRLEQSAGSMGISEADISRQWETVRKTLFAVRKNRPHPLKDDKILTDWNGLMIGAFAMGARILAKPKYLDAARRAADCILSAMRDADGRLLHRRRDGESGIAANAGDYACSIHGLLELYRSGFDPGDLEKAVSLQQRMIDDFLDNEAGGFYLTAADSAELPVRPKELYDSAMPSANSVALMNLARLARLTGNTDYETLAWSIIRAFSGSAAAQPAACAFFLSAVDFLTSPSVETVIAGDLDHMETRTMIQRLNQSFIPNLTLLVKTPDNADRIEQIAPFTTGMTAAAGGAPSAYVCAGFSCQRPVSSADGMMEMISGAAGKEGG